MNDARKTILDRLRLSQFPDSGSGRRGDEDNPVLAPDEKTDCFINRMRAVRTEVHDTSHDSWLDRLHDVCQARQLNNLLVSPHTRWGTMIYTEARRFPALKDYSQPIETGKAWKSELFTAIDASVTGAYCGIAETGTLILWPDVHEPRTMSLVPPIHIVLLEKSRIYNSLTEAMQLKNWALTGMPSNVILISGPSKSADIEQTMTYGVHGPRELIVILV